VANAHRGERERTQHDCLDVGISNAMFGSRRASPTSLALHTSYSTHMVASIHGGHINCFLRKGSTQAGDYKARTQNNEGVEALTQRQQAATSHMVHGLYTFPQKCVGWVNAKATIAVLRGAVCPIVIKWLRHICDAALPNGALTQSPKCKR
jgi:hypothetical protein